MHGLKKRKVYCRCLFSVGGEQKEIVCLWELMYPWEVYNSHPSPCDLSLAIVLCLIYLSLKVHFALWFFSCVSQVFTVNVQGPINQNVMAKMYQQRWNRIA
jgi:hypothetical protein